MPPISPNRQKHERQIIIEHIALLPGYYHVVFSLRGGGARTTDIVVTCVVVSTARWFWFPSGPGWPNR